MITATCRNSECDANGVDRFTSGDPDRVQCGACAHDCELSNPQPDPPEPELIEETEVE